MANIIGSSLESWKAADFNALLKELDGIANDIANDKDQFEISRKLLIDKNKKFKEQVQLETRKQVAPLLKSFQNEVDSLNKRNKILETQILMMYKKFIDLPDPSAALELAFKNQMKMQKSQDVALENKKLRETLEEFQQEFSEVKNQEITVKQLRDKIKEMETNISLSIETKCKEKERQLLNSFAEKERDLMTEKLESSRKVMDYENRIQVLEKAVSDSQSDLFQMKMKYDEISSAKTAEIDLVLSENERAVDRIKQLESQICQLKKSKESLVSSENDLLLNANLESQLKKELNEMQLELTSKDNEIIKLSNDIRKAHQLFSQNERRLQGQVEQLERDISDKSSIINKLKIEIQSHSDYDEIKRELAIIKSIEFSLDESSSSALGNGDSSERSPPNSPENCDFKTKSLEQLLLEKNRHLQTEVLQMKSVNTQMQNQIEKLNEECGEFKRNVKERQELVDRLEEDLHNMKAFSSSFRGIGEGADSASQVSMSDQQNVINKPKGATILANVLEGKDDQTVDLGQNSILSIVQSQRDRFKARAHELESNCVTYQHHSQYLQSEIDKIRSDNVKLYEKIRFLQSYCRNTQNDPDDGGTLVRYSKEYEEHINPFETFHRREKQRQYQSLPPHEKIMLSLGKFIMGNRTARLVAFLYTLLLHFLIFIVLYKLAHTEVCIRDQVLECRREFQAHMVKEHSGTKH